MTNYFKGDALELKMYDSAEPTLLGIGLALQDCYNQIYGSVPLGEFLYDENRVPLTNAIKRDIFIMSFNEIFEAWAYCGTAESYLLVLRKIFGDDATIEFTVPNPGHLQVNVETSGTTASPLIVREIVDNAYVLYNLVDDEGDNICASTILGIESQYELEKVLYSMSVNGIFTEVSLTIGS